MAERYKTWHWRTDADTISPGDFLTDDMRVSDLVHVLEHLPFKRRRSSEFELHDLAGSTRVRDFLVRAIKPR